MEYSKNDIDKLILDIISKNDISDQSKLLEIITEKGVSISQATLSRKLNKLNISKKNYIYKIAEQRKTKYLDVLEYKKSPPNLIVLLTNPGHAGPLGFYIDEKYVSDESSNILGCIAGDDTVLVITDGQEDLNIICKNIEGNLL